MASELSKFIEDELKSHGVKDEEEQRLLSNLRLNALSVEQEPPSSAVWRSRRKGLVVGGSILLIIAAVVLLVGYLRGGVLTTRDIVKQPPFTWDGTPTNVPDAPATNPTGNQDSKSDDYQDMDTNKDPAPQQQPLPPEETTETTKESEEGMGSDDEYDYDYEQDPATPKKDGPAKAPEENSSPPKEDMEASTNKENADEQDLGDYEEIIENENAQDIIGEKGK